MKTINWTKVPSQVIDGSLWCSAECPKVSVDYTQLDELFCQAPRPKSSPTLSSPRASTQPALVHLLESKRSLAVNILLKQHKAGPSALLQAISDGTPLPVETLKALHRLLPQPNELALIRSHPCEVENLGAAEKFYLDLSNIPHYELRILAMIQKEEVPVSFEELEPRLTEISNICHKLMEDASLKRFLALILQVGNYLNSGSYAGEAAGFKLNTLPKLLDTRANKPNMTFLHYIVEIAQSHGKDNLSFTAMTPELRKLARIPISALEEDIALLAAGLKKLKKQISSADQDVIKLQFGEFISGALKRMKKLEETLSKVRKITKRLALHFCEDPKTFKLEECFNTLADFFDKTQRANSENEARKKKEENAAKVEKEKVKARAVKKSKYEKLPPDEDCLIDLLMKEIRGGTFKLRRSIPVGQG